MAAFLSRPAPTVTAGFEVLFCLPNRNEGLEHGLCFNLRDGNKVDRAEAAFSTIDPLITVPLLH
jgi:hypothetical protein